jgi:2',3'-cyclic-nucleotide 2'-phosphodiesterase (5'-nucleotidase family)
LKWAACFLVAALAVASVACHRQPAPDGEAVIVFSNDTRGRIGRCDCAHRGIPGQVAALREQRATHGDALLTIDAGGFFRPEHPDGWSAEHRREREGVLAEAMKRAGYDAVLFQAEAFTDGPAPVRTFAETAGVTPLVGNLTQDGEALGPRTLIVSRGGLTIGLLGLTRPLPDTSGVEAADPAAVLTREMPDLNAAADVTILVTDLSLGALRQALNASRAPDVVLRSGEANTLTERPVMIGATPVFSVFRGAGSLGKITLQVREPGGQLVDFDERRIVAERLARYREYVAAIDKQAGGPALVEEHLAERPDALARYRRYSELTEAWDNALDRLEQSPNRYRYEVLDLAGGQADATTAAAFAELLARLPVGQGE